MKKLLTVLAALVIAVSAHAQFGIIAGVTSPSQELQEAYDNYSLIDQYHAGITVKIPLFLGFAVQPSLIYDVQGRTIEDFTSGTEVAPEKSFSKVGSIQLPVQVQWGLGIGGIGLVYAFAEPYVGYMVDETIFNFDGQKLEDKDWEFTNRLTYGAGVGVGVEVLKHIQVSARYIWNMGNLLDADGKANINGDEMVETVKKGLNEKTNNGIKVSLAFLF